MLFVTSYLHKQSFGDDRDSRTVNKNALTQKHKTKNKKQFILFFKTTKQTNKQTKSRETKEEHIEKLVEHVISHDEDVNRTGVVARYLAVLARKSNYVMKLARPTAYASEVGESFRPLASTLFVNTMYGISFGYVGLDVGFKGYHCKQEGGNTQQIKYLCMDQLLWHSMASLAFPGLTIHRIVHFSVKKIQPKLMLKNKKLGRFTPLIVGIGSIPFIIKPIDFVTDAIMDNTFRKYFGHKYNVPKPH